MRGEASHLYAESEHTLPFGELGAVAFRELCDLAAVSLILPSRKPPQSSQFPHQIPTRKSSGKSVREILWRYFSRPHFNSNLNNVRLRLHFGGGGTPPFCFSARNRCFRASFGTPRASSSSVSALRFAITGLLRRAYWPRSVRAA